MSILCRLIIGNNLPVLDHDKPVAEECSRLRSWKTPMMVRPERRDCARREDIGLVGKVEMRCRLVKKQHLCPCARARAMSTRCRYSAAQCPGLNDQQGVRRRFLPGPGGTGIIATV